MRFKVGDRVRIKSLDWYNENKDEYGYVRCIDSLFTPEHSKYCGCEFTISHITEFRIPSYVMDNNGHEWTDEMIEGFVEEENVLNKWTGLKVELELSKSVIGVSNVESLHGERFMSGFVKAIIPPEGYQFVDENGNVINTTKIVLEKKKKEYPKTYEECCKVLNTDDDSIIDISVPLHYNHLLISFTQLLICRDAYWKLYGEDMGLGKPWELSIGTPIYYIYYNRTVGTIKNDYADDIQGNIILAFPTKEMRDAFYENFKEFIEQCKELL